MGTVNGGNYGVKFELPTIETNSEYLTENLKEKNDNKPQIFLTNFNEGQLYSQGNTTALSLAQQGAVTNNEWSNAVTVNGGAIVAFHHDPGSYQEEPTIREKLTNFYNEHIDPALQAFPHHLENFKNNSSFDEVTKDTTHESIFMEHIYKNNIPTDQMAIDSE